jgi:hypothetical protein
MIRGKSHHRWPDPFVLLIAIVVLCAVMTTAASAGELFSFFPKPELIYQLKHENSGFTVTRVGSNGGGLNVSLTPPIKLPQDFLDGQGTAKNQEMLSNVFLFVSYPW